MVRKSTHKCRQHYSNIILSKDVTTKGSKKLISLTTELTSQTKEQTSLTKKVTPLRNWLHWPRKLPNWSRKLPQWPRKWPNWPQMTTLRKWPDWPNWPRNWPHCQRNQSHWPRNQRTDLTGQETNPRHYCIVCEHCWISLVWVPVSSLFHKRNCIIWQIWYIT